MRLFDVDGPLMSALAKLADIIFCNMMFVIFSLPVFTAGASLAALYSVMQSLVAGREDDNIFKQFWLAFKQNFKQGTLLWFICLAIIAFLAAYYFVITGLQGTMAKTYSITFYILALVFMFGFQYFFPLQARYDNKVKYTLKNGWLLSIAALPWTVLSLAVIGIAVWISFYTQSSSSFAIYFWAFGGFGIVAYINSFFFKKAFQKITPEMERELSSAPEEAIFIDEAHRKDEILIQESTFSNPNWNRADYDPYEEEHRFEEKRKRKKRR